MAKDNLRDRARALGERARALIDRITPEEVERAQADAEEPGADHDAQALDAAREAIRRRAGRSPG